MTSPPGQSCTVCYWVVVSSAPPQPALKHDLRQQALWKFSHPEPASADAFTFTRDRWLNAVEWPSELDRLRVLPRAGVTLDQVRRHRSGVLAEQRDESERLLRLLSASGIPISAPVVKRAMCAPMDRPAHVRSRACGTPSHEVCSQAPWLRDEGVSHNSHHNRSHDNSAVALHMLKARGEGGRNECT
jgi:hypothetical protein